jgi:mannosyl-oligosaccharide glucosidase
MLEPAHVLRLPVGLSGTDQNVFILQKALRAPFSFDVAFLSRVSNEMEPNILLAKAHHLTGAPLMKLLTDRATAFDRKFEDLFGLSNKGFDEAQINFAKWSVSSLNGGIGYFSGTWIVDRAEVDPDSEFLEYEDDDEESDNYFDIGPAGGGHQYAVRVNPKPTVEGPVELFTATPSRPFFPRGFLWDEGFHLQLIGKWDNELSLDIIESWANRIEENGWIAREQILGDEARSKVPQEFITQYPHHANPPTLILPVWEFVERLAQESNKVSMGSSLGMIRSTYVLRKASLTDWFIY